jgi:hypothetical protein
MVEAGERGIAGVETDGDGDGVLGDVEDGVEQVLIGEATVRTLWKDERKPEKNSKRRVS